MSTTNPPFSLNFFRLRWHLQSPNPTSSITVLQDALDANSLQGAYSPAHPIAQAPLTNPPVLSITISVESLDEHAAKWTWVHSQHVHQRTADSPNDDRTRNSHFDAQGILQHCCGEPRPGPSPALQVVAS
jgi:hypothetical protein